MAKITNPPKLKSVTDYTIKTDPINTRPFGIYNFIGVDLLKFNEYCFRKGLNRTSVETQTEFLLKEINHNSNFNGKAFKQAKTIEQAASIFHEFIVKFSGENSTIDTAYEYMDRNNT